MKTKHAHELATMSFADLRAEYDRVTEALEKLEPDVHADQRDIDELRAYRACLKGTVLARTAGGGRE